MTCHDFFPPDRLGAMPWDPRIQALVDRYPVLRAVGNTPLVPVDVLRRDGFAAATARTIAGRAGCNQGLVFYYFGSVVALLLAALDEVSAQRRQRYDEALAEVQELAQKSQSRTGDAELAWVQQAGKMNLHLFGHDWLPSQVQALNPIFILLYIPLFTYVIYPAINRFFPLPGICRT